VKVDDLEVGQRVRLRRTFWRFGEECTEGQRGTVVTSNEFLLSVELDDGRLLHWRSDWDTQVHQPVLELELVNEPLEDLVEATRDLLPGDCVTIDAALAAELGWDDRFDRVVGDVGVYVDLEEDDDDEWSEEELYDIIRLLRYEHHATVVTIDRDLAQVLVRRHLLPGDQLPRLIYMHGTLVYVEDVAPAGRAMRIA
jgi:hypothetical protein